MKRGFAVADCETDPFKIGRIPKPFVWGYYDGREFRLFHSTREFVRFVKTQNVICYAHNGGKYDWHFLLPELSEYSDIQIINGRIARVMLGAAELRDSYNILPVPLRAYKKDDIDYAMMEKTERHKPKIWAKIIKYLRSDCVYLYELIERFIAMYGVQITQASAAMGQWKAISQKELPNSTAEFYEQISPYYYGGRVECFESGIIEAEFSVYDINSAYPRAMLTDHPYSTNYVTVDGYEKEADFYRVKGVSSGAFPFRGEGNPHQFSGLRFPNDDSERVYTVTAWEYDAAIRTRTVARAKVLESLVFGAHTDFANYINHFYRMRLDANKRGDKAESLFAKLLMNSLYGKFAANPDNYKDYMIVPMDVIGGLHDAGWQFAGELGPWGLAQAPLQESQMRYYNVATGASITGYVRAMLWEAICSSKGVLYCDTDSIAVRKKGSRVILGEKLGQWKYEGSFDKAGIAGKKLYIFRKILDAKSECGSCDRKGKKAIERCHSEICPGKHKRASKGARLTDAELWEVAAGGFIRFTPDVPTFSVTKAPRFTSRDIKFTAHNAIEQDRLQAFRATMSGLIGSWEGPDPFGVKLLKGSDGRKVSKRSKRFDRASGGNRGHHPK